MAGIHYRVKESVPQDVEGNSNALTIALHAFFFVDHGGCPQRCTESGMGGLHSLLRQQGRRHHEGFLPAQDR